jgi:hypothetical protein
VRFTENFSATILSVGGIPVLELLFLFFSWRGKRQTCCAMVEMSTISKSCCVNLVDTEKYVCRSSWETLSSSHIMWWILALSSAQLVCSRILCEATELMGCFTLLLPLTRRVAFHPATGRTEIYTVQIWTPSHQF